MLSFLTLGHHFETYLRSGVIRLSTKQCYEPLTATRFYEDPDPAILDFIHKEYWTAVTDAQIHRKSSVPKSFHLFKKELYL